MANDSALSVLFVLGIIVLATLGWQGVAVYLGLLFVIWFIP